MSVLRIHLYATDDKIGVIVSARRDGLYRVNIRLLGNTCKSSDRMLKCQLFCCILVKN